jgi:hypothetical protein
VMAQSATLVAPTIDALGHPYLVRCFSSVGKFGRVLK